MNKGQYPSFCSKSGFTSDSLSGIGYKTSNALNSKSPAENSTDPLGVVGLAFSEAP